MSKPILTIEHGGADVITCYDAKRNVVLILQGEVDVKPMEAADLDPYNDDDLFTYANHLLGGRFAGYNYVAL